MGLYGGNCGIQPPERYNARNDDPAQRRHVQRVVSIGAGCWSIFRRLWTVTADYVFCRRYLFHRKSIPLASGTRVSKELAVKRSEGDGITLRGSSNLMAED